MALFSKENFTADGAKQNLKKFAVAAREALKKRWWVMLIEFVALAVMLIADLLSKQYVSQFLMEQPGHTYKLIPGFIHLTYSENTGAGFGSFSNSTTALIVVTFIVIIGLLVYLILAQKQSEWLRASLLLIVGGGIGNLVDRLGLGYVRDFIEYAFLKNFAICNVADVFVTVGAVMLIVVLIVMLVREGRKNAKEFEEEQKGKQPQQVEDPLDAPPNLNPMLPSQNDYDFKASPSVPDNVDQSSDGKVAYSVPKSDYPQDIPFDGEAAAGGAERSEIPFDSAESEHIDAEDK